MTRSTALPELVERVIVLLEVRQGDVSADEAVEVLACSPRNFRRIFRQTTGLSFRDAQLRARLIPARVSVRSNEWSISKIAERFGYKSRRKFDQSYKKVFGLSPARDRDHAEARPRMATQGVDSSVFPV